MIENLNNEGLEISIQEVNELGQGVVNRVHICRALMNHGYISSVNEGFEKYIGDHCKAYVARRYTTLDEAIEAIHKDNGIAVIAHPYEYRKKKLNIEMLLEDLVHKVDGIECFHPSATEEESLHLLDIAKRNDLIVTGGSDFHGINKPNIKMNMMQVDDEYMIRRR